MENNFILKPIQQEVRRLVLVYYETSGKYSLVEMWDALSEDYTAIFTDETIPEDLNLEYYRKEEV